jgi:hypothetical protein
MGSTPSDFGGDVPPVSTPDVKIRSALSASGLKESGIIPTFWAALFAGLLDGLHLMLTLAAGVFDDIAALITEFFTAAQGQDTPGFNNLVSAVLSDTLGVEVSSEDLQQAQFQSGRVGAMNKAGEDLFATLANEFLGVGSTSTPGTGVGGLPGVPGVPLTPEQGVKAAQSFLGFALSFAVRQGNVAFFQSILPWEWMAGIREYGEMMAKNLGLGRLTRQALRPFIQTLISTPMQEALNRQYRPHVLDVKQLASAYIRSEIDRADFDDRLKGLGYKDADIPVVISDSYSRLPLEDVFLLHENGFISDSDLQGRVTSLGFNSSDVPLLLQAKQLASVQGADRKYATEIVTQLANGVITSTDYQQLFDALRLPKLEKDALTRNANALLAHHRKQLALGFLHKAYLDGQVTINEYTAHALALGYSQDDVDLLEVQLLLDAKNAAAHAAAKAAAAAAKLAKKTSGTPTTPPAGG